VQTGVELQGQPCVTLSELFWCLMVPACRIWKAFYWVLFRFLIWDMVRCWADSPRIYAAASSALPAMHMPACNIYTYVG
jgi:hypothetical protein